MASYHLDDHMHAGQDHDHDEAVRRKDQDGGTREGGHQRTNSAGGRAGSRRPTAISSRLTSALNLSSESSADCSLGNISQMMHEEREHQRVLDDHQRNSTNVNNGDASAASGASIEDNLENMERLLIGLENKYGPKAKEEERRRRGGGGRGRGRKMLPPPPRRAAW